MRAKDRRYFVFTFPADGVHVCVARPKIWDICFATRYYSNEFTGFGDIQKSEPALSQNYPWWENIWCLEGTPWGEHSVGKRLWSRGTPGGNTCLGGTPVGEHLVLRGNTWRNRYNRGSNRRRTPSGKL